MEYNTVYCLTNQLYRLYGSKIDILCLQFSLKLRVEPLEILFEGVVPHRGCLLCFFFGICFNLLNFIGDYLFVLS